MDLSRTLDVVIGLIFILGPFLLGEWAVSLKESNEGQTSAGEGSSQLVATSQMTNVTAIGEHYQAGCGHLLNR